MDATQNIENNIEIPNQKEECYDQSKIRQLLKYIIMPSSPVIEIIDKGHDDGDVKFSVSKKDLGISNEIFNKYKNEIMSDFMVNFMGELLIRENTDRFAKILITIDKDNYGEVVNKYEHKKCGVQIFNDRFVFIFHISLIQNILTENFKKEMQKK